MNTLHVLKFIILCVQLIFLGTSMFVWMGMDNPGLATWFSVMAVLCLPLQLAVKA